MRLPRRACWSCRRRAFRSAMILTLLLAGLFIIVQIPALATLLNEYGGGSLRFYGLIFFLIVLHAAHVIGGMIPLGFITANALAGRYDHEHFLPVKNLSLYWHFLDVVWLFMFVVFLITR